MNKHFAETWQDINFIYWIYNWTPDSCQKIIDNVKIFVQKHIMISLKYGINIPFDYFRGRTIDDITSLFMMKYNATKNKWHIMPYLYKEGNDLLYPCNMFIYNENRITNKIFLSINEELKYSNDVPLLSLSDYSQREEIINMSTFQDINGSDLRLEFGLHTDAFFSTTIDSDYNEIDNSMSFYLNGTRFNSYIRDTSVLYFEFGAYFMEVIQDYDRKCPILNDIYLKSGGEVIFYEDVYDLLPDEHRVKNFEKIQYDINKSFYEDFLKKQNIKL